ncbi:hypothetical protein ACNOYE_35170 [Nannocystaceae bacterium ST9]
MKRPGRSTPGLPLALLLAACLPDPLDEGSSGDALLLPGETESSDDHGERVEYETDDTDETDETEGETEDVCGDGIVGATEECDVANLFQPCNPDCTSDDCYWNLAAAPLPAKIHADSQYGEIAFDSNCDLIITGAKTQTLYRLSHVDGTVSAVGNIAADSINSLTAHVDGRLYIGVSTPNQIWALELDDSLTKVADIPANPHGMTSAPAVFGGLGSHLIWGADAGKVYATNPVAGTTTIVGSFGNGVFSDVAFGPDGTLYVGEHMSARIRTLTADGVFSLFADLPSVIDGLIVDPAGTALHVASYAGGESIDSLSIPGAVKTEGPAVFLNGGSWPTGMVFDSSGRLLHLTGIGIDGGAAIDSFVP